MYACVCVCVCLVYTAADMSALVSASECVMEGVRGVAKLGIILMGTNFLCAPQVGVTGCALCSLLFFVCLFVVVFFFWGGGGGGGGSYQSTERK